MGGVRRGLEERGYFAAVSAIPKNYFPGSSNSSPSLFSGLALRQQWESCLFTQLIMLALQLL